jgi:hypothetical protein
MNNSELVIFKTINNNISMVQMILEICLNYFLVPFAIK